MLEKLKGLLGLATPIEPVGTELVYIVLPEPLMPVDRGDKYEDPLDAELKLSGLGYISGGGSSLSDEDGRKTVEWCGVDVDTTDVVRARQLLRQHLTELGCLPGTQLHYRLNDVALRDSFDGRDWILEQPRNQLHPGFGI